MLTPPMSDEELDELVRRSAEAYPEELPLGNWLRMEDKLHEAATARLVRQKIWRFFGLEVAVVALLLLLWQGYKQLTPAPELAQQPSRTTAVVSEGHSVSTSSEATSTAHPSLSTASPAVAAPSSRSPRITAGKWRQPDSDASRVAAGANTYSSATPTTTPKRQSTAGNIPVAVVLTPKRRLSPTEEGQQRAGDRSSASTKQPAEESVASRNIGRLVAASPSKQESEAEYVPEGTRLATEALAQNEVRLSTQQENLPQRVASLALTTDSTKTPPQPERTSYRLVAGVIGAPAWSAVRTLSTAQLGGNVGLTLEYRLTSRLRVRTGLVRSVKRYEAASSDYTPLPSWNWRPGTYEVYANCRITEIPLDLRYDVVQRPSYALFGSVGLTSLLMRNERYSYDYQVNSQLRTAAAKVVNGSNYAFGLLTVSGGIERPLSSRWSGQVEPFLQMPLGSVGAGKVRLSSAGVSFSLKYGLLR